MAQKSSCSLHVWYMCKGNPLPDSVTSVIKIEIGVGILMRVLDAFHCVAHLIEMTRPVFLVA